MAALLTLVSALIIVFTAWNFVQNTKLSRALHDQETANGEANIRLWESLRDRAKGMRLSGQPGQRFEALRSIGDAMLLPLPEGHSLDELRTEAIGALALPDIELRREWKIGGLDYVDFDESGRRYARLLGDGTIEVREVADDSLIASWQEPGIRPPFGAQNPLSLSPDGRYVALLHSSSGTLFVRRLDGPNSVLVHRATKVLQWAFRSYSPDSTRLLYAVEGGGVCLLELATGSVRCFQEKADTRGHLRIDPTGTRFACHSETNHVWTIEIRELETGRLLRSIDPLETPTSLAWHPNGYLLGASGADRLIRIWDVDSGKLLHVLGGHKSQGIRIAFDQETGLLLSNDWHDVLRVWDPLSGQQLFNLPAGGFPLLQSNHRGLVPIRKALDSTRLQLLRIHASAVFHSVARPAGGATSGYVADYGSALIAPDGRILAVPVLSAELNFSGIALIDTVTERELGVLPMREEKPLHWDADGALVTCGDAGLWRWPVTRDQADSTHLICGPPEFLLDFRNTRVDFGCSRDGRRFSLPNANAGGLVWDRDHPNKFLEVGPQSDVRSTAMSPDGRWVVTGSHESTKGEGVKVWNAHTAELVHEFPNGGSICEVRYSPGGRWLYTSDHGRIWHTETWEPGPVIGGPSVCFARDDICLAVEKDLGAIRLVEPGSGREIVRLEAPLRSRLIPSYFTADGSRLVSIGRDTQQMHIWDLRKLRHELRS